MSKHTASEKNFDNVQNPPQKKQKCSLEDQYTIINKNYKKYHEWFIQEGQSVILYQRRQKLIKAKAESMVKCQLARGHTPITIEEATEMIYSLIENDSKCHHCTREVNFQPVPTYLNHDTINIDRIDSFSGYKENYNNGTLKICCQLCNFFYGSKTSEQRKKILEWMIEGKCHEDEIPDCLNFEAACKDTQVSHFCINLTNQKWYSSNTTVVSTLDEKKHLKEDLDKWCESNKHCSFTGEEGVWKYGYVNSLTLMRTSTSCPWSLNNIKPVLSLFFYLNKFGPWYKNEEKITNIDLFAKEFFNWTITKKVCCISGVTGDWIYGHKKSLAILRKNSTQPWSLDNIDCCLEIFHDIAKYCPTHEVLKTKLLQTSNLHQDIFIEEEKLPQEVKVFMERSIIGARKLLISKEIKKIEPFIVEKIQELTIPVQGGIHGYNYEIEFIDGTRKYRLKLRQYFGPVKKYADGTEVNEEGDEETNEEIPIKKEGFLGYEFTIHFIPTQERAPRGAIKFSTEEKNNDIVSAVTIREINSDLELQDKETLKPLLMQWSKLRQEADDLQKWSDSVCGIMVLDKYLKQKIVLWVRSISDTGVVNTQYGKIYLGITALYVKKPQVSTNLWTKSSTLSFSNSTAQLVGIHL